MVFDPETGDTTGNQVRAGSNFNLFRNRWRLETSVNYDVERSLMQQVNQVIQYTSQCWALRLEFREIRTTVREDRDIRLALSLNNIGTFLDLNSTTRQNGNTGFF